MSDNIRKKRRDYMRKYNLTEKGKAYNNLHVKEWRRKNPARKRTAYNRHTSGESWKRIITDLLIRRDGFNCGICGGSLENSKVQINHIVAVALGGPDTFENVNLAHAACNVREGVKIRKQIHGY